MKSNVLHFIILLASSFIGATILLEMVVYGLPLFWKPADSEGPGLAVVYLAVPAIIVGAFLTPYLINRLFLQKKK